MTTETDSKMFWKVFVKEFVIEEVGWLFVRKTCQNKLWEVDFQNQEKPRENVVWLQNFRQKNDLAVFIIFRSFSFFQEILGLYFIDSLKS